MAYCSLLTDNSTFAFDHAMAHRGMMMAMVDLYQYSAVPYMFDPEQPNAMWRLYHQSAHDDAIAYPPPLGPFGIPYPQNFIDIRQDQRDKRGWWIFANHMSHITANSNILSAQWLLTPAW
jgi:hypothetical protein